MPVSTDATLEAVAYHEAGHAVMAVLSGATVREVVAGRESDGTYAGHVSGTLFKDARALRVAHAGTEAVRLAGMDRELPPEAATEDRRSIEAAERALGPHEGAGLAERERVKTRDTLRRSWSAVERIAGHLLRSPTGRLDGKTVHHLVHRY